MNFELNDDEMAFEAEVRAFIAAHLPAELRRASALTPSVFHEPKVYLEWQRILRDKGWLAYNWPKDAGGTGWGPTKRYIFERECAYARAPNLAAQGLKMLAPVLHEFGTSDQQQRFLPHILSGEHIWCQGYSEPEAGSDLASLRTKADRQDDDHYVVNGTKIWTTNAHLANWMFCLVRTDVQVKAQKGISFLLIDMTTPGIKVEPIGLISGDQELNQVFLDNVVVPVGNRIGDEGHGWTIAKFLLEHERGGACQAPGLLADLADLRELTGETPSRDGRMFADDNDFMHRLSMVELAAQGMEMVELQLLAETAAGQTAGPQTALLGLYMADIRQNIDRLALEMAGPAGLQLETRRPLYSEELHPPLVSDEALMAMPRYLNNRAWSIMAGSSEIMRTIIARTVVGL